MLAPDARTVAVELLRPPSGYRLERAVLTTYSLDLETLLALPLAVQTHADRGLDNLLGDPLLLLEPLRTAREWLHVFVDHSALAIPRRARSLYTMLESSVYPVRAPNGGAFHPKVWFALFTDDAGDAFVRVVVLSRNLTYDRSWDVALTSEGRPSGKRRVAASRPLGDLLRALPEFSVHDVADNVATAVRALADEVERTRFASPDGFDDPIEFHALGLTSKRRKPWLPLHDGVGILAVAPFANRTALDALVASTRGEVIPGERILVSRQETLDAISEVALKPWHKTLVLSESAAGEAEDAHQHRPSGLHAKIIAIEQGWNVTWFVGSANLTAAAFTGHNVEVMASVTGKKGRKNGQSGSGIERFIEAGFLDLCEPYRRRLTTDGDPAHAAAVADLENAQRALLDADLSIQCSERAGLYTWTLNSLEQPPLSWPDSVEIAHFPITVGADQARPLNVPSSWRLPTARLTAFVAFRLYVPDVAVDDIRLTRKLPLEGVPEDRAFQVLRALIDSPEKFLQFLRALLGGLDELVNGLPSDGDGSGVGAWLTGTGGDHLLEDLVRVASRDPHRLKRVRRIIEDCRKTEEGRRIVPDELFAIWTAVDDAVQSRGLP